MRISMDEVFQLAEKILKIRAEAKKVAAAEASGVLNQHRQSMQARVALANEVQSAASHTTTPTHAGTVTLLEGIANKIHDLTQERK